MNPIQKAIMDVKYKIPPQILQAAFVHREFGHRPLPTDVDALIRDRVINARVMVDCNLLGGQQVVIPLSTVAPEYLDPRTVVYRIPKSLTQGRSITRPLSMGVGLGTVASNIMNRNSYGYSAVLDGADAVVDSHAPIPMVSTANLRMIAENVVMVTEMVALPSNIELRCYIENDEDFSSLRTTAFPKFSRLVELAVKAYIYNELSIPMGQGQLVGGMELGKFREIIDGYADANEMYDTYLQETWNKVATFTDANSRERHLRLVSGGRR
jgi:hypothetical protein